MVSVHPRQLCSMVIVVLQNNRYHHESYRIINTGNFIFTSTSLPYCGFISQDLGILSKCLRCLLSTIRRMKNWSLKLSLKAIELIELIATS